MSAGFLGALLTRAARDPHRVLFTLHEGATSRDLTQAGLVAAARPWASLLALRGVEPGAVVLIALPLGPDLIHAFLGTLLAGCVPSFMPCPSAKQDHGLFWASHDALFSRLGGGLIVTTAVNAKAIAAHVTSVVMAVVTPEAAAAVTDISTRIHPWLPGDVACLQHSSGTTGLKKGVMLRFDQIDAQLTRYAAILGSSAEDTIVSWLPLYHDMGFIACFLMPLAFGNRAILMDPFAWLVDPLALFDLVERHRGNFVWLPNFAFNHLVNAAPDDERRVDLISMRAFIDCSEPCKAQSLNAFAARFRSWGLAEGSLRTCYAMAETVFAVTQSGRGEWPGIVSLDRAHVENGTVVDAPAESLDRVDVVSSGRALPDVELAILDEDGTPVAADRIGEIAIRAPFLFAGYHLDPERTAAVFREGFYKTGDLGFLRNEQLFVLGRRDDLLILLGRNVFANEIETILGGIGGLKPGRVLAMGLYNEEIGSQALIVVAERDGAADVSSIRADIRARLEGILGIVPRKIEFVQQGWLVKSTSGKINRAENRRKYLAHHGVTVSPTDAKAEGSTA